MIWLTYAVNDDIYNRNVPDCVMEAVEIKKKEFENEGKEVFLPMEPIFPPGFKNDEGFVLRLNFILLHKSYHYITTDGLKIHPVQQYEMEMCHRFDIPVYTLNASEIVENEKRKRERLTKAVKNLYEFRKNWCYDTNEKGERHYKCDECAFHVPNRICLITKFRMEKEDLHDFRISKLLFL